MAPHLVRARGAHKYLQIPNPHSIDTQTHRHTHTHTHTHTRVFIRETLQAQEMKACVSARSASLLESFTHFSFSLQLTPRTAVYPHHVRLDYGDRSRWGMNAREWKGAFSAQSAMVVISVRSERERTASQMNYAGVKCLFVTSNVLQTELELENFILQGHTERR